MSGILTILDVYGLTAHPFTDDGGGGFDVVVVFVVLGHMHWLLLTARSNLVHSVHVLKSECLKPRKQVSEEMHY